MKRFKTAMAAAAVILAVTGCGGKDIGKEAALEAALNDAGVSEDETTRLKVSEDREDGRRVYDIQFDAAGKEYDYEIAAADGKILSADQELLDSAVSGNSSTVNEGTTGSEKTQDRADEVEQALNNPQIAGATISTEEAMAIALERVPGATEKDIVIKLDYDDGVYKYEGDIIHEQMEYEFEIDANTGTILEWSEERP